MVSYKKFCFVLESLVVCWEYSRWSVRRDVVVAVPLARSVIPSLYHKMDLTKLFDFYIYYIAV